MIKTASWFTRLPFGHVMVGISRGLPRGRRPFVYHRYPALNPGVWFNKVPLEEYLCRYQAILDQLDPHQVAADLQVLAHGGTPVLLCFEQPGRGLWCHRALVASWLAAATGEPVPEVGYEHLPQDQHPLLPPPALQLG
jgi:hypothetical protein